MSNADASAREALFRKLAQQLLAEPAVTQGTMMGYPCLRANGGFLRQRRASHRAPHRQAARPAGRRAGRHWPGTALCA